MNPLRRLLIHLSNRTALQTRANLRPDLDAIRSLIGVQISQQRGPEDPTPLSASGFKVFSQFDEDGILIRLCRSVPGLPTTFVEIGVEDYSESITRWLVDAHFWSGLVVDVGPSAARFVNERSYDLMRSVQVLRRLISLDNLAEVLAAAPDPLGLLALDIDGNDYHLLPGLLTRGPGVVVCEYQTAFGAEARLVTPYSPDFDRHRHHPSGLCAGASLTALNDRMEEHGYRLVATSHGPNAFFVRNDLACEFPTVSVAEAYRLPIFRDGLDATGRPVYPPTLEARQRLMADGQVIDLADGRTKTVAEALSL